MPATSPCEDLLNDYKDASEAASDKLGEMADLLLNATAFTAGTGALCATCAQETTMIVVKGFSCVACLTGAVVVLTDVFEFDSLHDEYVALSTTEGAARAAYLACTVARNAVFCDQTSTDQHPTPSELRAEMADLQKELDDALEDARKALEKQSADPPAVGDAEDWNWDIDDYANEQRDEYNPFV